MIKNHTSDEQEEQTPEIEVEEPVEQKKKPEKKVPKSPDLKDKSPEEIADIMAKQLLQVIHVYIFKLFTQLCS